MKSYAIAFFVGFALSSLWLVIAIAGIIAYVRTKNAGILLQTIGAILLLLHATSTRLVSFPGLYLPGSVLGDYLRFIPQLAFWLGFVPGIILFTLGYCLEKFRQKSPTPAAGFPIGSPPPGRVQ